MFIPLRLLLGCCLQGLDQGAFIGYSLQSGCAQAQSRRPVRKDARAVVWDEALADGPGIVALRYGASNVVGWVGWRALGYGASNVVGWVGWRALGGDRGADAVFKNKRDR